MGIYPIGLAGESFRNDDGSDRQREIGLCRQREPVTLERDPQNPYDGNAIKAVSARGICIGMVPRQTAGWLAERIDSGRPATACVLKYDPRIMEKWALCWLLRRRERIHTIYSRPLGRKHNGFEASKSPGATGRSRLTSTRSSTRAWQ